MELLMRRGRWLAKALLGLIAAGMVLPAQAQAEKPAVEAPANRESEAEARKKLIGVWRGFVVAGRGERTDRGPVKLTEVVIAADTIRAKDDTMSFGEGKYRLDLTQSPRRLDPTGSEGSYKGLQFTGIYVLEGDTLKWCVANPGKSRPTEYKTTTAVQFYMVLKRVEKPANPEAPA
ncbi:MAG: TIGR03067 domain-containing protein [Actinomycetota bacterium]